MSERNDKNIILLPIYPEYANAILAGKKTVEFRKNNIPDTIKYVVIYSTVPEQKVVGYFKVKEITQKSPAKLWKEFSHCGAINREKFFNYYRNNKTAKGILIDKTTRFKNPVSLNNIYKDLRAPQSFKYIDQATWNKVKIKACQ